MDQSNSVRMDLVKQDMVINVQMSSSSSLTELEQLSKEEWAKISGASCLKLVETDPDR